MTVETSGKRSRRAIALVALIGILVPLLVSFREIRDAGWDPTLFAAFGEQAVATREYAEERLGEVYLRPSLGHDGRFFFVQANDPWVLQPDDNAAVLDRPYYRSQRMLYPVLAGGFGLFGPEIIVWAMLVVNLLAMGVGTWIVAQIAEEMGGSPWWGLAFVLNIGFFSEVNIGGAGVVAAAAAFGAVLMFMRDRVAAGTWLLVAAVLAREAMLIAVVGVTLWLWLDRRRKTAMTVAAIPGLAVLAWAFYLRLRIGEGSVAAEVEEIGWPFVGLVGALARSWDDPLDLVVGVAMLVLFVLFTRRALMSRHVVGLAFLGFVVLGLVFTEQVWRPYFNITRAVAPTITAFVLLVFLSERRDEARTLAD